ncbi:MAG: zinc transporter, family [Solirubrobacteraceae bacterium]|jgi:ZIP family zinc transporter|nr:zinc transporter, family [Solirubrobacteraceae bacterium]MEA2242301.1 zinc transporter, family [Solirubrobacteraceae bacterium]
MSFAETAVLGALAGFTIFLGLPVGRLQLLGTRGRVALAMFSVGILVFLLVDVLMHGFEISESAVSAFKDGSGSFGHAAAMALLLVGGFGLGSAGLGILERQIRPEKPLPPLAGGAVDTLSVEDDRRLALHAGALRAHALRTGLVIAAAIGVHNFAEGLAIGVSAHAGEIGLATVLIIGFALHNSTEGFGIIGPLGDVKPSWRWLGLAGLIGGAPTFLGAMIGYNVTSEPLELAFYAVAGGAIFYVIAEITSGMRRLGYRELGLVLLACGFAAGILTDLVVAYGGG